MLLEKCTRRCLDKIRCINNTPRIVAPVQPPSFFSGGAPFPFTVMLSLLAPVVSAASVPRRMQIKLANVTDRISGGDTCGKFCKEIIQCWRGVGFAGCSSAQVVIPQEPVDVGCCAHPRPALLPGRI